MRSTYIIILVTLFSISSHAQNSAPYNLVQGKLIFKQSYCGGARPSEEMLAYYDSLRPLSNTTIYLSRKIGGKNIYKLVSDGKGNFKKCARAGKYFIYMSKDYDQSVLSNFNPDCAKWMKSNFGELEIIDGGKKLYNITLHFGCDPCSPPRP
ncbi:MAG: hypothetical protein JJE25_12130 [Bacteroidia bacterium]|nr:hypothetical protein [Bacteroidia bacterium]